MRDRKQDKKAAHSVSQHKNMIDKMARSVT